jgi:hypothetical protein
LRKQKRKIFFKNEKTQGLHATEFVTLLPFVGFFLILQLLWLWQTQFGGCFAVATAKARIRMQALKFDTAIIVC